MTLIKTTKDGRKVTVENGWVCLAGERYTDKVEKIGPWMKPRVEEQFPGMGMEYHANALLFTEAEGLKAKELIDTHNAEQKAKEQAEQKAQFEALVASGAAFRTVEITGQYGCELHWARRFTAEEKKQYSDWFKDRGVAGITGSHRIKVEQKAVEQVIGNRPSDAEFCGCSNTAWTITEEEWEEIARISQGIKAEKEKNRKEYEKREAADLQHKVDTGYCFNCETWCHGDCGNYSNDPHAFLARELKRSVAEANYGIQD